MHGRYKSGLEGDWQLQFRRGSGWLGLAYESAEGAVPSSVLERLKVWKQG
jgi:hypothetical protein